MKRPSKYDLPPGKLREVLTLRYNVDDLKKLADLLPAIKTKPTRKLELVDLLEKHVLRGSMRIIWEQLDELQQKAVSETLHEVDPDFNESRFEAKYGELPEFATGQDVYGYGGKPSRLQLFLYKYGWDGRSYFIPDDVRDKLLEFVPEPEVTSLQSMDEPPEYLERIEKKYDFGTDRGEPELTVILEYLCRQGIGVGLAPQFAQDIGGH